uniref:RNase H type-1 domain-containing protein n=1 Tax=Manihot esculenta TaxID=3983 RepID=A0A2C9VL46_MANES
MMLVPLIKSSISESEYANPFIKSWGHIKKNEFFEYLIKWNVDGSYLGKPGPIAIGGVLRDTSGCFKCLFSCLGGIKDSNSRNAVSWVNEIDSAPWKFSAIINSIVNLSAFLRVVSFKCTLREAIP